MAHATYRRNIPRGLRTIFAIMVLTFQVILPDNQAFPQREEREEFISWREICLMALQILAVPPKLKHLAADFGLT